MQTTQSVFEYKVFRLKDVLHCTNSAYPDAYFAHDANGLSKQDWDAALAAGFRWIRTDGELVILERKSRVILGRKFLSE
jgi:hypothetical protein